ncbi:MAG: serine/threonine protein kinase [Myxococcales bacterium]|nr:serine/threonine protein kinase [Myxococcales bacterium]
MAPGVGSILRPGLVLVRPLGEGAMGSVWVAESADPPRTVAVKFMGKTLAKNAAARTRFQREAAATARIDSPHVVKVLESGATDDGAAFIVMELLEGETLGQRIERLGRIDPGEAAAIVRQIATALDAAHALGIIHRDIKPDNVFIIAVGDRALVKIVDFGMVKATTHRIIDPLKDDSIITGTGVLVGTPDYMSPEQALGSKEVDAQSDLWALGAVAYRALTGRLPFEGETLHALVFAICRGAFTSLAGYGLPEELDTFFRRAFNPGKRGRFASGNDLAQAFEDVTRLARDAFRDVRIAARLDALSTPSGEFAVGESHAGHSVGQSGVNDAPVTLPRGRGVLGPPADGARSSDVRSLPRIDLDEITDEKSSNSGEGFGEEIATKIFEAGALRDSVPEPEPLELAQQRAPAAVAIGVVDVARITAGANAEGLAAPSPLKAMTLATTTRTQRTRTMKRLRLAVAFVFMLVFVTVAIGAALLL